MECLLLYAYIFLFQFGFETLIKYKKYVWEIDFYIYKIGLRVETFSPVYLLGSFGVTTRF